VSQLLKTVPGSEFDFEWYPTSKKTISAIYHDVKERLNQGTFASSAKMSFMDVGAGNGKLFTVIKELSESDSDQNKIILDEAYAIEKSEPLLRSYGPEIYVVGTDFESQTLIDKKVDILFSNPPYSDFVAWSEKIIREANCRLVYLVIPKRWQGSEQIANAVKYRRAKAHVIDTFDFTASEDRKARAKVDVVCVDLNPPFNEAKEKHFGYGRDELGTPNDDPFDLWFNEFLGVANTSKVKSEWQKEKEQAETIKEKVENQLVAGGDLIGTLEALYQSEMKALITDYQKISELDSDILRELDVNVDSVKAAFRQRINGLKDRFWHELFERLDKVTDKLTSRSRKSMLEKLSRHVHVDFTASNARAILIWTIKNANQYFDKQLMNLFDDMTDMANVALYRSNKRTIGDEMWRYGRTPDGFTHYKLELQIVLSYSGGIYCGESFMASTSAVNGLELRASELLDDIVTVANNLGFTSKARSADFFWESGKKNFFNYVDGNGEFQPLMQVKAFKNGNMHIKFAPIFIMKLNVENGRLREITPLQLNNQIH
jgi:hypothetical protein